MGERTTGRITQQQINEATGQFRKFVNEGVSQFFQFNPRYNRDNTIMQQFTPHNKPNMPALQYFKLQVANQVLQFLGLYDKEALTYWNGHKVSKEI